MDVFTGRAYSPVQATGNSVAVRYDHTQVLGSTWRLELTARKADNSVIDLTSATIKHRISSLTGTALDTRQTSGSGITITTATLGTYVVIVTPAQQSSAALAGGTNYKYEVQITDSGSVVYDQLYGILSVEPSLF